MIEQITYKFQLIQQVEKELNNFEFNLDDKSPCWMILAKRAKYEFMRNVIAEIYDFHFTKQEYLALLEEEHFLEFCWTIWAEDEQSIAETIEYALKVITYEDDDDA